MIPYETCRNCHESLKAVERLKQLRERIEQLPRFDPGWSVGPTKHGPYIDRDDVLALLNSQQEKS